MSNPASARTLALQKETNDYLLPLVADPMQDLARERKKASFNPLEITRVIYGGDERIKRRRELLEALASDARFSKEERYFKSQKEAYEMGLRMMVNLQEKVMELGLTRQEDINVLRSAIGYPVSVDLHFGMFLPTIVAQGTKEQKEDFFPRALTFQVMGTYAQTELGHGTFLRGLETTATFDREAQEYILHTPTITATKWWPGGLGKTANYVTLMARLFVGGKDHGPHAFLVQIRDLENHLPLPGIEVGDIGPKLGFNTVDNGFLRLNHVRVPASALLSKNVTVTKDGEYQSKASGKAAYGTMVLIRSYIVSTAAQILAKAVTIATRYSAVRRQTSESPRELEKQILDYQNQQFSLLPLLATTFALHFTGEYMSKLYATVMEDSKSGDASAMPELHATSSGLKALVTSIASEGIEICRKSCGGHGYSHFSGLPLLYEDYVAACTYEGENTIMHLQTARYLMKAARNALAGKNEELVGNAVYLRNLALQVKKTCAFETEENFYHPANQLLMYQHRAAWVIHETVTSMNAMKQEGASDEEAWGNSVVDLVKCSQAHCFYMLLEKFVAACNQMQGSPVRDVMKKLCDLFALFYVDKHLGDFTQDGFLSQKQIKLMRKALFTRVKELRNEAVGLVDGWDFHDYELNSALGRKDGDVYNALYQWAKKAPMNEKQTGPGYEELLRDKFRSNL